MKRSFLFILLALILIGVLIFAFRDQLVSETSTSDNIKTTEVLIYSNCPIEETTLRELITVYQDSSCPKIQIIRMDLPTGQNTGTITIPISFMNKFRASLFPLPVDFLMEDVTPIKTKAFEDNIIQLISQKQGNTDCLHDSIRTKWISDSVFRTIKVLDSVNKFIKIQKKHKVVFKVLGCGKGTAITDDRDGDGFKDKDDKCPDVKGTVRGCLDSDGDGLTDDVDKCDSVPGNCDGCIDKINLNVKYNYNNSLLTWVNVPNCQRYKITIVGNQPGRKLARKILESEESSVVLNDFKSSVWNKHEESIQISVQPIMDKEFNSKCLQGNICKPKKLKCD